MGPYTDLPVEEVLPDGSGRALSGRVPAQILQLLVNPFQRHLYTPSSICKQMEEVQICLFRDLSGAQELKGIDNFTRLDISLRPASTTSISLSIIVFADFFACFYNLNYLFSKPFQELSLEVLY